MSERVVIIGGGVTGLAAAGFLADRFDCTLLEREDRVGGYCRSFYQDGFTWDCSGHFFHFTTPWVAERLHRRLERQDLLTVKRQARVFFRGRFIDAPFQFNIHQLPLPDFIRCLADMHEAQTRPAARFASFREMLYGRYGRALSELFLIPYNEKLYARRADELDADAMGRFFPHIEFGALLRGLADRTEQPTYNTTFSYHRRGAQAYVEALLSYVPRGVVRTGAPCERIDWRRRKAIVGGEEIPYDRLIVTAPLPRTLAMAGLESPAGLFSASKVVVFNLGFDRRSRHPHHWVYFPEPEWVFFRVGHYDNILGGDRMSLYVEISLPPGAPVDQESLLQRVLADLERCGIVDGHKPVSRLSVVLDPAYVHLSSASMTAATQATAELEERGIFPLGRYGRWVYCSIEDNILAARRLADAWGAAA